MRLARKLQLAYFSLIFIPFASMGILILVSYYGTSHTLGAYQDLEAPGWIRAELAAIFEEDWESYGNLNERVVLFVMDSSGYLLFPNPAQVTQLSDAYPIPAPLTEQIEMTPERVANTLPNYLPEVLERFGTEWTLDITMSPVSLNDERYLTGWKMPAHGIPGFVAERKWFPPMFFLVGIMLIPAFLDAKLRKSIQRLQEGFARLSSGDLDQPIPVLKRDDLRDLAEALNDTRIELKEGRDRKARFLMAVSHDLRTPLTTIKGYIEALNDGMARNPEEVRRYLTVLGEKAGLLEGRIEELIDFARSDTDGWAAPVEPVDIRELMGNLDAAFAKDCGFGSRSYASEIELPEELFLEGDYRALYRAWENLFSNAMAHTAEGDSIQFRAGIEIAQDGTSPEASILFGEIIDSGAGVPDDFAPYLFEAFARADKGRNRQGLGLGLASVKAVAEAHGGSVRYYPAEMGGAVFKITIPCR